MLPIIVYNESFSVKDTLWVYFTFITISLFMIHLCNCSYSTLKLNYTRNTNSYNTFFFSSFWFYLLIPISFRCRCSVCLLDYQPDDRLQQIPVCGHTFHMNCIDLWLASHSTCPLCRLSLLPTAKSSTETSNMQVDNSNFHNFVSTRLRILVFRLFIVHGRYTDKWNSLMEATSNEEMEMQPRNDETLAMEFSDSVSTSHLETTVIENVSGEIGINTHPRIDVEEQNVRNNQ